MASASCEAGEWLGSIVSEGLAQRGSRADRWWCRTKPYELQRGHSRVAEISGGLHNGHTGHGDKGGVGLSARASARFRHVGFRSGGGWDKEMMDLC